MTHPHRHPRRIRVAVLIGLLLVAACAPLIPSSPETEAGVTPTLTVGSSPTETQAATPTPTGLPTVTAAPDAPTPASPFVTPIVDDGVYFPVPWIRLEYDLSKWQKRRLSPGNDVIAWFIDALEPALVHKTLKNCYLGVNNPRGLGPGFELRRREELIGNHLFSVLELFSESDGGQIAAVVYGFDIAVEYPDPVDGPACLADAKEVLATYADFQP